MPVSFELLSKSELIELSDRLLIFSPQAIEMCVSFIEAETVNYWHGRARAQMARRLKHCQLSDNQQKRVSDAILKRLKTGLFSEQFKDQLRLVMRINPKRCHAVACTHREDRKEHVRRYCEWILTRLPTEMTCPFNENAK